MTLNEEQARIVEAYPLEDLLSHFPDKLRDLTASDESWRSNIASLLQLVILDSEAAHNLLTSDSGSSVFGNLIAIRREVRIGKHQFIHFLPLINAVVANSPDVDIWSAVLDLITAVGPSTPPITIIIPTFNGTPVKSLSQLANSETRDIVERELFYEIKNCTFRNVGGFCDKFFNPQSWRKDQKEMLEALMAEHDGKKWTGFPSIPDEQPVWVWLRSLEESAFADAPYKLHTTQTANKLKEQKGQMDIFFKVPGATPSSTFKYKQVLVVGEQKKTYDKSRFKADFLQLTRYVRGVFSDQPTRRFVHAFTICASTIELWVFDRSGAYSSGPFDIHDNPDTFARAIVGYATMDDVLYDYS